MPSYSHRTGFTTIELMITLAVIAVLASLALPAFQRLLERSQLKSVSESIRSNLELARSDAIKRSSDVTFVLTNGNPWSYTINSLPTITVLGNEFPDVSVGSDSTTTFEFRQGRADEISIELSTTNYQSEVRLSESGRVILCTPSGQTGVGYPSC